MTKHWKAILFALLVGLVIGWFDRGATEVQGTLLLLLVVAFGQGLLTRAPSWLLIGPLSGDLTTLGIHVVALCGDGHAAREAIRRHKPDLLFLDVEMPEIVARDVGTVATGESFPVSAG